MKINQKTSIVKQIEARPDLTKNFEGGIAFEIDAKTRLYARVSSCLVSEPKFYKTINEDGTLDENQDKDLVQDILSVSKEDPEFILQLANHSRNYLHLRTVSIVLLVEASLIPECKPFVRKYAPLIIKRADELTEAVAYLQKKVGHLGNKLPKGSMPSALKRGIADSFNNFNDYALSKYNRDGFVKLKDVLRLVHPKPKDKGQSKLYKKILDGTLESPDTWEVLISTKGSTKENWEKIIPSLGYMASLRNLRNFLDKEISDDSLKQVTSKLIDEKEVKNSKQFPFRFLSAYRELEDNPNKNTSKILDALETAMDVSVENLPKLKGTTFVVADNSGSMGASLSRKSKVKYEDVANCLLAITHRICDTPITGIFGTTFAIKQFSKRNGTLSNVKSIRNDEVGSSTNAYLTVDYLIKKKIKVDRILLLSDMQCYITNETHSQVDTSFAEKVKQYKAKINPKVYIYSVDLAGYGTAQIPQDEPNTCLIAGWSEKILNFIELFEKDKKTAIDEIKNYGSKKKSKRVDDSN